MTGPFCREVSGFSNFEITKEEELLILLMLELQKLGWNDDYHAIFPYQTNKLFLENLFNIEYKLVNGLSIVESSHVLDDSLNQICLQSLLSQIPRLNEFPTEIVSELYEYLANFEKESYFWNGKRFNTVNFRNHPGHKIARMWEDFTRLFLQNFFIDVLEYSHRSAITKAKFIARHAIFGGVDELVKFVCQNGIMRIHGSCSESEKAFGESSHPHLIALVSFLCENAQKGELIKFTVEFDDADTLLFRDPLFTINGWIHFDFEECARDIIEGFDVVSSVDPETRKVVLRAGFHELRSNGAEIITVFPIDTKSMRVVICVPEDLKDFLVD